MFIKNVLAKKLQQIQHIAQLAKEHDINRIFSGELQSCQITFQALSQTYQQQQKQEEYFDSAQMHLQYLLQNYQNQLSLKNHQAQQSFLAAKATNQGLVQDFALEFSQQNRFFVSSWLRQAVQQPMEQNQELFQSLILQIRTLSELLQLLSQCRCQETSILIKNQITQMLLKNTKFSILNQELYTATASVLETQNLDNSLLLEWALQEFNKQVYALECVGSNTVRWVLLFIAHIKGTQALQTLFEVVQAQHGKFDQVQSLRILEFMQEKKIYIDTLICKLLRQVYFGGTKNLSESDATALLKVTAFFIDMADREVKQQGKSLVNKVDQIQDEIKRKIMEEK